MEDEFDSLKLSPDLDENKNDRKSTNKVGYYDRKLESRLKKYEAQLKKHENINRVYTDSQFLFVGNGGLENNISQPFLEDIFGKYGSLVDVVMPKKKSYAFVIYDDAASCSRALEHLQAQVITENQTPICFYLFPVDKVPESTENHTCSDLPPGLMYIPNYISNEYAQRLIDHFLNSTDSESSFVGLKKRQVKHYGYEFRYGTNDVDLTKPLVDSDTKIPDLCDDLIEKMLNDGLITMRPDQLTVNFYEPGHGIGAHIDNVKAFGDYIVSLSLLSSVSIEFKHRSSVAKLLLEPNSLLVMRDEARYEWTHGIPERKHDILVGSGASGQIEVSRRQKRISLTFRKVISTNQTSEPATTALVLPRSDHEAAEFERSHVHTVYNQIATHFSQTRYSTWPGVAKFLASMQPYSSMLDIGCGNGKYLGIRKDVYCFGCDYSDQLIQICQEKNFNCFVCDCLRIPCADSYFDYVICIAVLHHLSTDERRIKAIIEMTRLLRPGGRCLITVWAKEQKYEDKESFYISKNSNRKKSDGDVHTFGKEFGDKQDVFVAWRLKNSKKDEENKSDVYLRFYHVFEKNELERLFESIPNANIVESFYEQGNWCVIFEKKRV